jgi:hypothetical protein
MVFEIPQDVNVYDLIAVAVIEQAVQDAHSKNQSLAEEAQQWLDDEGRNWWETMGLDAALFNKLNGR